MARTEDSHAAKLASKGNAAESATVTDPVDAALPEPGPVVSVRNESPAQGIGRCVRLSAANTVLPLLPQDPRRRHALVLAVDNDVYIAHTLELAQAVEDTTTGSDAFYLPAGVPIPVVNKGAWWAACTTTASASRISVMVDKDDE